MSFDWPWPNNEDQTWDGCRRRAWKLYHEGEHMLSHERSAYDLGHFLKQRIEQEQPAGAAREALLSVIGVHVRIASYVSCGERSILMSLAMLLRLAIPYADHPDHQRDWMPA
jgi:hypothetical protein